MTVGKIDRTALPKRVLLLATSRTYRAYSFIAAADRLGIEVTKAINMEKQLADYWNYPLGLQFDSPEEAAHEIRDYALDNPIGAILSVDDSGTIVAAVAAQLLNIPHITLEAAEASRNKYKMRQLLLKAGVRSPKAQLIQFRAKEADEDLALQASHMPFPCILKPLSMNGSQGVIRANSAAEFVKAAKRIARLLVDRLANLDEFTILAEPYIPGFEVAVEGLTTNGKLEVLALFDKPDPLEGPYFEETIYVRPSRLSKAIQDKIIDTTNQAVLALGLYEGPIHAELRVNEYGAWIIEVAGRSIGGLCSKTLQFGVNASLEEIILRNCFDMAMPDLTQEGQASGVMMIPIPEAGLLKKVDGCEEAAAVPLIESLEITAKINNYLTPLPEGDSYLGFIFARGESPSLVEDALREAHKKLRFSISPGLAVFPAISN